MPSTFYHPRFWPTWFGVGVLKFITLLPWSWQMAIGKGLGVFLYFAIPSRRKISCINLSIAFPELSPDEILTLNKQHFISSGRGFVEAALAWWGSNAQIKKLTHFEGLEYVEDALENGEHVVLLGAHFSSLEIGGRIFGNLIPSLHVVYRPHQNALIEYLVALKRGSYYSKAIPKTQIREMIKSVRNGYPAWYATDQNYRSKGSILVPFFGVDAPTNPGTSRIAKITNAKIIPVISVRLQDDPMNRKGYLVRLLKPLDNFPTKDALVDTTRLNQILEASICEFPDQYLWTHKRYKYYNIENKDFYKEYLNKTNCAK